MATNIVKVQNPTKLKDIIISTLQGFGRYIRSYISNLLKYFKICLSYYNTCTIKDYVDILTNI